MTEIQSGDRSATGRAKAGEIESRAVPVTEDNDSVLAAITAAGLPVVPLIDAVAFPRVTFPLQIGRPFSVAAVEQAAEGEGLVLLVAQKRGSRRKVSPKNLYRMGTVAQVVRKYRLPEGGYSVLMQGLYRAEIVDTDLTGETVVASVAEVRPHVEEGVDPGGATPDSGGAGARNRGEGQRFARGDRVAGAADYGCRLAGGPGGGARGDGSGAAAGNPGDDRHVLTSVQGQPAPVGADSRAGRTGSNPGEDPGWD